MSRSSVWAATTTECRVNKYSAVYVIKCESNARHICERMPRLTRKGGWGTNGPAVAQAATKWTDDERKMKSGKYFTCWNNSKRFPPTVSIFFLFLVNLSSLFLCVRRVSGDTTLTHPHDFAVLFSPFCSYLRPSELPSVRRCRTPWKLSLYTMLTAIRLAAQRASASCIAETPRSNVQQCPKYSIYKYSDLFKFPLWSVTMAVAKEISICTTWLAHWPTDTLVILLYCWLGGKMLTTSAERSVECGPFDAGERGWGGAARVGERYW